MTKGFQEVTQVLEVFGGNDFNVERARMAKKQRNGTVAECLAIDRNAYRAAFD